MQQRESDRPRRPSRIRALRSVGPVPAGRTYDRRRDLPRLIPLMTQDLDISSRAAHSRLVELIRKALRAERMRANSRHWAYNPARHAGLVRALRQELAALRASRQSRCRGD